MASIIQEIMQETAAGVARREATSVSRWSDWYHPQEDAAARYAARHGLADHDPKPFRQRVDNEVNITRWAWIVKFCERWGIVVPEAKSA